MKNYLSFFFILFLIVNCTDNQQEQTDNQLLTRLENYYEAKDYFGLKRVFEKNQSKFDKAHLNYYQAVIATAFNNPAKSLESVNKLVNNGLDNLDDSIQANVYEIKLQNHIYTFEYDKARRTIDILLSNYKTQLDSVELSNYKNEIKLWKALSSIPKQEIIKKNDCLIQMTRDKAGLQNIEVSTFNKTSNFIFDTGANISTIRRSLVDELNLKMIPADFYVTAVTGQKVDCDLAVADSLIISDLIFRNVVFLVMEDDALSFPQADYYINGIVGWPVINAMEEIQITDNNNLFVPLKPAIYNYYNFAMEGLTPLVLTVSGGDSLIFRLDTGAGTTDLYKAFYLKYEDEVKSSYSMKSFNIGGAGGVITVNGFIVPEVTLSIAGSVASLDSLSLLSEKVDKNSEHLHGNLGQDFINQFNKMIISFKYSSVSFE